MHRGWHIAVASPPLSVCCQHERDASVLPTCARSSRLPLVNAFSSAYDQRLSARALLPHPTSAGPEVSRELPAVDCRQKAHGADQLSEVMPKDQESSLGGPYKTILSLRAKNLKRHKSHPLGRANAEQPQAAFEHYSDRSRECEALFGQFLIFRINNFISRVVGVKGRCKLN